MPNDNKVIVRIWPNTNLPRIIFFKRGFGHVSLSTRDCTGNDNESGIYVSHFPGKKFRTLQDDLAFYKKPPILIEIENLNIEAIEKQFSEIKLQFSIAGSILSGIFSYVDKDGVVSTNCSGLVAYLLDVGGLVKYYGKNFLQLLVEHKSTIYSNNIKSVFGYALPVFAFFAGALYGTKKTANDAIQRVGNYQKLPEHLREQRVVREIIRRKEGVIRNVQVNMETTLFPKAVSGIKKVMSKNIDLLFSAKITNPLVICLMLLSGYIVVSRLFSSSVGKVASYAVITPNDVIVVCNKLKNMPAQHRGQSRLDNQSANQRIVF